MLLRYLKSSQTNNPNIRKQALTNLINGYQSVLSYQNPDGGFGLFCGQPSKMVYTAYAGLFFADINDVYPVDQKIFAQITSWLWKHQDQDGVWTPSRIYGAGRLNFTALVIQSLQAAGTNNDKLAQSIGWLLDQAANCQDPYSLALCLAALPTDDKYNESAQEIAKRLSDYAQQNQNGSYWNCKTQTLYRAYGRSGRIETTSLAIRGFLMRNLYSKLTQQALDYLSTMRGSRGDWGTTSATVAALKAIIAIQQQIPKNYSGKFSFNIADKIANLEVSKENYGINHLIELGPCLSQGNNRLKIDYAAKLGKRPRYLLQIIAKYYLPWETPNIKDTQLHLVISYNKKRLSIGESTIGEANISYQGKTPSGMIILDWRLSPGMIFASTKLQKMVQSKIISRYELNRNHVILYLPPMKPNTKQKVTCPLQAIIATRSKTQTSKVYDYYNPEIVAMVTPEEIIIE